MLRFVLTSFFILSGLGQEDCHAQSEAAPSNSTLPAETAAESKEIAHATPKDNQDNVETENPVRDFSAEDLAVQERMADAAEEVNRLVKKQNSIAIIGLVFVSVATFFAGMAWRAGSDAVKVTRKIGTDQLRAYIGIVNVTTESKMVDQGMARPKPIDRPSNKPISVIISMKNFGQTPANSVNVVYCWDIQEAETCLLYTSPSPRDRTRSRMPSSA